MADSVTCALPGQKTPDSYYNIERMLKSVIARGGDVKACGSRGLKDLPLIVWVEISTMSQLTNWTLESDKMFTL